jgi:GNAT superfamily N-acetyltransferase
VLDHDAASAGVFGRNNVEYRNGVPEVAAYATLFATTGWAADRPLAMSELERALAGTWRVVAAYDAGELVGIGRIVSDGVVYALIVDVIVAPSWQRRGIGTEITGRLVAMCEVASIRYIHLFAAQGKRAFYERQGFVARADDAPGMRYRPRG